MSRFNGLPPSAMQLVNVKALPAEKIFVRALSGAEFLELGPKLAETNGPKESTAVQFEMVLCSEDGKPFLEPGEGLDFIRSIYAADARRLMKVSDKINAVSDAAIEAELKN